VSAGLKRDAKLQPTTAVGRRYHDWPTNWRDTEQLIGLWPAVYAVAWEMAFSSRRLTYPQIAAIA